MASKSHQNEENREQSLSIGLISQDIAYIKKDVSDIKLAIRSEYVTKSDFEPIKKIIYGMVSVVLFAVVGAIVTLVIKT